MTLGDLANLALVELQQPGASFTVGGGGGPNWASQTNPQFSQGLVEFAINEGYKKTLGDLEDLELALVSFTFVSTLQTYRYAIPPAGYAAISHVAHVWYQPSGLPYSQEFPPALNFVSWNEFQRRTGYGYLLPYAFGTQPRYATIDPTRAYLYFFPGSAIAGDTVTVEYSPIPTQGATGCPTLVAQTDTPIIPADCHMPIFYYAMHLLWTRAREMEMARLCYNPGGTPGYYQSELATIRAKYTKKHHGDTFQIVPFMDRLGIGGM